MTEGDHTQRDDDEALMDVTSSLENLDCLKTSLLAKLKRGTQKCQQLIWSKSVHQGIDDISDEQVRQYANAMNNVEPADTAAPAARQICIIADRVDNVI